eukprot:SAG22_NODE_9577_length_581_cov_1.786307_1_plen_68_part_10
MSALLALFTLLLLLAAAQSAAAAAATWHCPDARTRLNETMEGAEAAFIASNSACLQRCIPPAAPPQQP